MPGFEFNTEQYAYNLVNALGCARASQLTYEDSAGRQKSPSAWGFNNSDELTHSDRHFAIVMGNAEMVLIAFRGTDQWADWWTNLNILFKRSQIGMVHRGFMKATELFWPALPERISEFFDGNQSIWITGHSLGGALAVLTATKLYFEHKMDIAGLYTFGQPPVGTVRFCRNFEEQFPNRYFRFVNHVDAVFGVPILFREHMGEVRYFDTDENLHEGQPSWRVNYLDHVKAPGKYGGLANFVSHSMDIYVDLLKKQIPSEADLSLDD